MLQYLTFIDFNEKTIRKMSPIWFSTAFLDFIQHSARFKGDLILRNGGMMEWNGGTAELRNTWNILKYGIYRKF